MLTRLAGENVMMLGLSSPLTMTLPSPSRRAA